MKGGGTPRGTLLGHHPGDALRRALRRKNACWTEGFIQADDYTVVFVRLCGCAKLSGVPIDAPFAHVWRFRDEQVDLWHAYTDRREALKAVGLDQ
jgi:ketosteroid isomerase-like protein